LGLDDAIENVEYCRCVEVDCFCHFI
jgi:hypothetical protein